jgi:hypothetical protein
VDLLKRHLFCEPSLLLFRVKLQKQKREEGKGYVDMENILKTNEVTSLYMCLGHQVKMKGLFWFSEKKKRGDVVWWLCWKLVFYKRVLEPVVASRGR